MADEEVNSWAEDWWEGTTWNGSVRYGLGTVRVAGGRATTGAEGATGVALIAFSTNRSKSSLEAAGIPVGRPSSFEDCQAKMGCQPMESHKQKSATMLLCFGLFH